MTTNTMQELSENFDYWSVSNPIGAKSGVDVIKAWIERTCSNSDNTLASYVKEIKRFLIFCDSKNIRFDHISANDINEYLGILFSPNQDWLKPKDGEPTAKTQILLKGLKRESVKYSQMVLNSFYSYIKEAGVIRSNPVALSTIIKVDTSYNITGKSLSFDAWDFLSSWLKHESLKSNNHHNRSKAVRDRWLMHLLYYTGARRSSISKINMACFSVEQKANRRVWVLNFLMKGNREHTVLLTEQLLNELKFYRTSIGLTELPSENEEHIPVVPAVKLKPNSILKATKPISDRGINYVIEESLKKAALECEDYFIAKELGNATPHTFRHTCATHWLNMGIDVVATQKHLGHKNLNTTMVYIRETDEHRLKEIDKLTKLLSERE
ncbi:tyrosine-type recombinase/integrase (plasmid) [Acinetobacter sp. SK-43]|uniref:tyrosine-type recombinase/integrase n=1 Tax=Acinetobacter sp. SK-43 TaxID=2785295 RepID=UPI00188A8951|nr:tyrosine-type recombinase/integrase [Acinetobacter sp. SK-43]MBF4453816.1 tyrosine-type recombinase/integrase [Acinetobacter sp. SK-43]